MLLSVLALTLPGWPVCSAKQTGYKQSPENLHSLVITFSPPSHYRANLANRLGSVILSALKAQPENIAQQIDATGGGWALTSNLSGVQLAFFASDNPWEMVIHALKILNELSTRTKEIKNSLLHNSDYEITLAPVATEAVIFKPITFDVSTSLEEYTTYLEASAHKLQALYQPQGDVISLQTDNQPIMAKIMHWPAFDFNSFFSAKFIGEQFLNSFSQAEELSYEIICSPSGIYLALLTTGSESVLFKYFAPINKFTTEIATLSKTHWEKFEDKATAILSEDSRDFRKTVLSRAWLRHFSQAENYPDPQDIVLSFVRPSSIEDQYAMPESFMQSFSRSENHFPRIATTRDKNATAGVDVSLIMQGNDHVIHQTITNLDSLARPSFTFSSSQTASGALIIHFYSTVENISAFLRTLCDFIDTFELAPESLDIAIASAGDLPPFVLKGLIESSWPGRKSFHDWNEASQRTFADLTGLSEKDTTALHHRWKLLTATPRGKAELLAKLAILGKYINSFELPLSKE